MQLYHYYESSVGPFVNLSDIDLEKAKSVQATLAQRGVMASKRQEGYLERRSYLERLARERFIQKGGKPRRKVPHYMVVEHCPWLMEWYQESASLAIPIDAFDLNTLSFTYGDMFPTFSPRVNDGKEYRNTIYTYTEILGMIEKYGLPQAWNADGAHGPERYIEVQVWCDAPLKKYYKP